jgi:hypothetical protein
MKPITIPTVIIDPAFHYQGLRGGVRKAALACGSKVLHPFFLVDFSPGRAKNPREKEEKYHSAEGQNQAR